MKKTELAIFDMDGLIFDSESAFMYELKEAMLKRGYNLTKDIYVQTMGLSGSILKEKMKSIYGLDYPFEEISSEARMGVTLRAERGDIQIKKGILHLLELLKKNGIKCVVASSSKTEYVRRYINIAGLGEFFCHITGGDCVKKSKPEPDIFILSCQKADVGCEKAVVFEDSENGLKAAFAAGIKVICIPDIASK